MTRFFIEIILLILLIAGKAYGQQTVQQSLSIRSNLVNSTELLMYKQDNTGYFNIYANNAGLGFYNTTVANTGFYLSDANNVGIGTINPSSKFDVRGNALINGSLTSSLSGQEIGGVVYINNPAKTTPGVASSWGIYNMSGSYGNSLQFWAYDDFGCGQGLCNNRLTLMDNGNVGIGTASPQEKLSVNGKIRAQEIKVETANWPDYVFVDDYNIGTLKELESYIKANKHLPDMPNAREIEINGLQVGEILKLQQQKIEELTLHLIAKDKELTKEKELNKTQNERLQSIETMLRKIIKDHEKK